MTKEECLKQLRNRADCHIHMAKRCALMVVMNESVGKDQTKEREEVIRLKNVHDELLIAISVVEDITAKFASIKDTE